MNAAFLRKLMKEILFRSPAGLRRYFFPGYEYQMRPHQLCFLCDCIEQTRSAPGSIVEVGCAFGTTTLFLAKYCKARGIDKAYYALDTFSGFVPEDVEYEVSQRGKQHSFYAGRFAANKQEWFDGSMRIHGADQVKSIQADVNTFDFAALGPLAFVLLDVDLYRPIQNSLPRLFAALSPGGIIVVDDCDPNDIQWNGADQAYKEFCQGAGLPVRVEMDKLGIIRKDAAQRQI